jgi:hypothetical protein
MRDPAIALHESHLDVLQVEKRDPSCTKLSSPKKTFVKGNAMNEQIRKPALTSEGVVGHAEEGDAGVGGAEGVEDVTILRETEVRLRIRRQLLEDAAENSASTTVPRVTSAYTIAMDFLAQNRNWMGVEI